VDDKLFIQCKKLTFNTCKGAKAFLKRHGLRKKQRAYKCPHCQYFHNTSEDSEHRRISREINERIRDDEI
jgi:transposase-like protein